MSFHKATGEYYDPTYQPAITLSHLGFPERRYIESYLFPSEGISAPTRMPGHKAAVWMANRHSTDYEHPIIAGVVPVEQEEFTTLGIWFVGAVKKAELFMRQQDFDSIAPREALLLEAAEHGPFSYFHQATNYLETIIPRRLDLSHLSTGKS